MTLQSSRDQHFCTSQAHTKNPVAWHFVWMGGGLHFSTHFYAKSMIFSTSALESTQPRGVEAVLQLINSHCNSQPVSSEICFSGFKTLTLKCVYCAL